MISNCESLNDRSRSHLLVVARVITNGEVLILLVRVRRVTVAHTLTVLRVMRAITNGQLVLVRRNEATRRLDLVNPNVVVAVYHVRRTKAKGGLKESRRINSEN